MSEFKFSWEPAAMRGDPMPEGLPLEEQKAFQATAHLYARFRLKQITREAGSKEKGMIAHQMDKERKNREVRERLSVHFAGFFRRVESAANRYALDKSPENAERLWMAVSGLLKEGKEEG